MKDLATKKDLDAKLEGLEMRLTFKIGVMLFIATCVILAKLKYAL